MRPQKTKITSQGQVSVPAGVRSALGLQPGTTLEWVIEGNHALVRRSGKYTFLDIHRGLFRTAPRPRSLDELREARARSIRAKFGRAQEAAPHARD